MKRAAILVLTIATLVLLGSPSNPLLARSTQTTGIGSGPSVITPADKLDGGAATGSGSGGSDQGDADGLSGMKIKPGSDTLNTATTTERLMIMVSMWWRYMLFIR